MRRLAFAVATASLVLLAAGCGSDNGGTATTTTSTRATTSRSAAAAAYVRKADAFCARIRPEFQKVPQLSEDAARDLGTPTPSAEAYEELRRFAISLERILLRHQSELAAIKRPDDPLVRRWFNAYNRQVRAVHELRLGAASHQTFELQTAINRNQVASRRYEALSRQLGFKACGASG